MAGYVFDADGLESGLSDFKRTDDHAVWRLFELHSIVDEQFHQVAARFCRLHRENHWQLLSLRLNLHLSVLRHRV